MRIIVADKTACYAALGVLHELYKPIPGKFKDYVAIPKANGYQSLHTTLFGPFGTPLEAQIRTQDMHRVAETGVAAHWLYKPAGELDLAEAQRETHRWLQSLLEIQSESRDSKEFLEHVKGDLFPDEIYVFTPKGKIMALPRGATAVDFAYGVHTDIGHHCVAARINYELLPLRTELKNGDHVEILTSPTARPESVVAVVRRHRQGALAHPPLPEGAAAEGIGGARRAAAQPGAGDAEGRARRDRMGPLGSAREGVRREEPARHPGRHRARQAAVVRRRAGADARSRARRTKRHRPRRRSPAALTLRGVEGVAIQYAHCCRPIPGDAIVGQFRKGQGLIVHLRDCVTLRKQRVESGELIDVEWAPDVQGVFDAGVRTLVADRRGLLADLATSIANADANIDTVSMERPDGGDVLAMFFSVQVRDRSHLAQVMRAMHRVPDVKRVQRART